MDAQEMLRTLDDVLEQGRRAVGEASTIEELETASVRVLGRKSRFAEVQRSIGSLPPESRGDVGQRVNAARAELEERTESRRVELQLAAEDALLTEDRLDLTLPGRRARPGSRHPFSLIESEIVEIFTRMGYRVVEGPEVEDEWHSFDALNIPPDHPARTSMDTTYVDVPDHPELVLRPHTSPMQIRTLESQGAPAYVVVPGRVYRNEEVTAKNMPVFHQVEGLAVDEGITFADLKGTLEAFYRALLGESRQIRLTPSFFPFVEPGAQVDVSCFVCEGSGCRTCAFTGWIETMGSGMVHPNVLVNCGLDPERYTGFAFGGGYDRLAMIRYGIPDIRLLWDSDVRFLEQFEVVS
ncbi:MAG TPA: phenylalanine--tRNA ligase subunit alpha [Actinomycetota bacterium]|nr:phenylalanine--tRNA ligase subunit alpha [Actinomycetota bacterium]